MKKIFLMMLIMVNVVLAVGCGGNKDSGNQPQRDVSADQSQTGNEDNEGNQQEVTEDVEESEVVEFTYPLEDGKIHVSYNDGKIAEITFNAEKMFAEDRIKEGTVTWFDLGYNDISNYVGWLTMNLLDASDTLQFESVDDLYTTFADTVKDYENASITELKEEDNQGVKIYWFVRKYVNDRSQNVVEPFFFVEIEPGVYLYTDTELNSIVSDEEVTEDYLNAYLEEYLMLMKETFMSVEIIK